VTKEEKVKSHKLPGKYRRQPRPGGEGETSPLEDIRPVLEEAKNSSQETPLKALPG